MSEKSYWLGWGGVQELGSAEESGSGVAGMAAPDPWAELDEAENDDWGLAHVPGEEPKIKDEEEEARQAGTRKKWQHKN